MKAKKVKYKVGQLVYSYQNKTKKYPIIHIYKSENPRYDHKYKLQLPDGSSNWIDESSIYLTKKKITGWRKGGTFMREEHENTVKNKKNVRVKRAKKGSIKRKPGTFRNFTTLSGAKKYHKDTKSHNVNIKVVSGIDPNSFFDVSVIKDLDDLKKQYRQLALKYHPDRGGTNEQMQVINAEHERLRNLLLNGSTLTDEQKKNEVEIDNTFRVIIDEIIHIEGIEIELIGKWLWVGSNLNPERNWQFETPTYNALKSAGLDYIKKAGRPYMVYKGVESKGRGKMTKAEIEAKYGKHKFETKGRKRINSPFKVNVARLKNAVKKLTKALDKRPV